MANAKSTPTICEPGKLPISRSSIRATNSNRAGTLIDSPGAGRAIYLTSIIISNNDNSNTLVSLEDGDGTVLFGPFFLSIKGFITISHDWEFPLRVGEDLSLVAIASGATGVLFYIESFDGDLVI